MSTCYICKPIKSELYELVYCLLARVTDDGFPSAVLNRQIRICVYMCDVSFETKCACTGILSLPVSLRDNERRYIDHRPGHSAEAEENGLVFRV